MHSTRHLEVKSTFHKDICVLSNNCDSIRKLDNVQMHMTLMNQNILCRAEGEASKGLETSVPKMF
jgi:hypothetical protein